MASNEGGGCRDSLATNEISWHCNTWRSGGPAPKNPNVTSFDFLDEILRKAGTQVVPDILANAGGVTVSYFEWLQNRSRDPWSADTVRQRLEARLEQASHAVADTAVELDCDLRQAAYVVALRRLERAIRPLAPE